MSSRLTKLPAELKLIIYELAFSPDHIEDEEIELKEQRGPEYDILATCSEVCNEAKPTFDKAVELFENKIYRYRVTVDHDTSLKWTDRRGITYEYLGPANLPSARSLAINFSCPYGIDSTRSFTIKWETDDTRKALNGGMMLKAGLFDARKCDPITMHEVAYQTELYCDVTDMAMGSLIIAECLESTYLILSAVTLGDLGEGQGPIDVWGKMSQEGGEKE